MFSVKNSEQAQEDVSVVIATLGGSCLVETIKQINLGSITPKEILICIPEDFVSLVPENLGPNVRIIVTESKGQVPQRATGFSVAKSSFVMQLDDDMLVDPVCIERLLFAFKELGDTSTVSPSLIGKGTTISVYKEPNYSLPRRLFYWLLNGAAGYTPGQVTMAGTCIGVDPDETDQLYFPVAWVPGGCVMHRKENLVLQNFFPFPGKAYSEDLIHSHFIKEKGVQLYICQEAVCYADIDPPVQTLHFRDFMKCLREDMRSRKYFLQLTGGRFFRMYMYYIKQLISYPFIRLKGLI